MAEPTPVPEAASELYAAFDPAFVVQDPANDWPLLRLCIALVTEDLNFIHEIVTDEGNVPGWQTLFDPDKCPAIALPYLAQYVGARLLPSMTEAEMRAAIKSPVAFGRGTPAQIEAVAKRTLTGTKTVILTERYLGFPWKLRVETLTIETPEPTRTKAEVIAEAKPIGILLSFNEKVVWTWGVAKVAPTHTPWSDVKTDFATWFAYRTFEGP
jgi:Phage tail protein (Tail_P2_I)